MKRNCNLELCLVTPSVYFNASETFDQDRSQNEEKEKLTIFYNGRIAACDVTEFQARAIIRLASGEENDDRKMQSFGDQTSPVYESPVVTSGLSMKRSLQRFLQKRKNRTQAMCPYSRPSPW